MYQTGGVGRSALTWLDRSGKPLGVIDDANFYQDMALSPDSKSVAATRLDPKTLHIALWITDLTRGIASRFTPEGEDIESLAWSPDGKRIAYWAYTKVRATSRKRLRRVHNLSAVSLRQKQNFALLAFLEML